MALKDVKLFLREISDLYIRDNFRTLLNAIRDDPIRKGQFRFVEVVILNAGTVAFTHNLGFMPRDVILTSIAKPSTATVSFKFDLFTSEKIFFTASAPCTLRFYVGSYSEEG